MNVRRRSFLLGRSALLALPFARLAQAQARTEVRVRLDGDIVNRDSGNRVGSIENNVIMAVT